MIILQIVDLAGGLLLIGGAVTLRVTARESLGLGLMAAGSWLGLLANMLLHHMINSVCAGALAAVITWLWWNSHRNRRRRKTLRELGAKSRARIQALINQITYTPTPSPIGGRS